MDDEHLDVNFPPRSVRLAGRMGDSGYRHAYVASHTRQFLARQMRELRGKDLSQSEFGDRIAKKQTVVSRLENPNYGKWTLQTLLDIARGLDIAVLVRFVDFPTFLRSTREMSSSAARPVAFHQAAVDEVAREDEQSARESALKAVFSVDQVQRQAEFSPEMSLTKKNWQVPSVDRNQIPLLRAAASDSAISTTRKEPQIRPVLLSEGCR